MLLDAFLRALSCLAGAGRIRASDTSSRGGIARRLRFGLGVQFCPQQDYDCSGPQPRHGGQTGGNMGPTAVVKTDDGFTLLLMSRRGGPNGRLHCGSWTAPTRAIATDSPGDRGPDPWPP